MEGSILVLVGPKGAGKTTIGAFLERRYGVRFLRVEPIWIEHAKGTRDEYWEHRGYERVVAAVQRELESHKIVVIETTGAAASTSAFLDALRALARVTLVRISCPESECLDRVRRRNANDHIPVSDDCVAEINAVACKVLLPFVATVQNTAPWDEVAAEATWDPLLRTIRGEERSQ
ncbi:MAG: AAA family ATPase [Myxococcaceae bacterium]